MSIPQTLSLDSAPPLAYLVAVAPGMTQREYALTDEATVLGRDGGQCAVVVAGATVSRRHARILIENGGIVLEDLDSTNGVYRNGHRMHGPAGLNAGDLIGLGSATPHLRVQEKSIREPRQYTLPASERWVIGRDPDCDLALPFESTVSGQHAILRRQGGILVLTDNHSLNGTWVHGRPWRHGALDPADTVVIGTTHFRFAPAADGGLWVWQRDCSQALRLEGIGLRCRASSRQAQGRLLLDDVTLAIAPGEFVGILGPSGAGKTTLLKTLAGMVRPERGRVLLDEIGLDTAWAMFRNGIGFVPQDDILHPELSVAASLDYTARLRLSPDLSPLQRRDIVDSTLETLRLGQVRQTSIAQLSGGQRKRVSLGAELLVRPGLLFLDEPTSGLDPGTEDRLMRHFRRMAENGTTVVITTHVLLNLDLLDKVAILAQGRLVFFGTPTEALDFFGQDGRPLSQPTQIFERLSGEESAAAPTVNQAEPPAAAIALRYAQAFRQSPLYERHIKASLSPTARAESGPTPSPTLMPVPVPTPPSRAARAGAILHDLLRMRPRIWLRSWWILSSRHLRLRTGSARRLLLLALVPAVLALVTLSQRIEGVMPDATIQERKNAIQASLVPGGTAMETLLKHLLAPSDSDPARSAADLLYALRYEGVAHLPIPMGVVLMMVMTAVFVGTLIACLEIAPERSIYRRERLSHLRIGPYLSSKLPFCLLASAGQCLIFVGLCWLHPALRQAPMLPIWLVLVAVAWSAIPLGLMLSAADPSGGRLAVMLAIAAVLPQLLLSGGLGPDFYSHMASGLRWLANLLPARWGAEMGCTALFGSLQGQGAQWISDFVRQVIGFDFGFGVYYSGISALAGQGGLWLLCCAGLLRYHDRR